MGGSRLTYLDEDRLEAADAHAFRTARPYPWCNPAGLLTEEGFGRLREAMPEPSKFRRFFGVRRSHGQQSHDRLVLEYDDDLDVADPWHEFVRELNGPVYRRFLYRMLGHGHFRLQFHWHYTPDRCSVSPHCDARHKLGSHIFYLNTADDWDPAWGGETLILDDGGRLPRRSAPRFEDFDRVISAEAIGNRSLLFVRGQSSWHGVREIRCPENAFRKVFIVVINDRLRHYNHVLWTRLRGKSVRGY
jgi:hypothetical protein